jgi:glyoxylase-like metal-dependent hydrolase (beta-lactamase superfamily II)/rhodanese-related sulfurtransferase
MFFRQYELQCLSLFSYLIGDLDSGRAVVVDPQRDVTQYLTDAAENGLHIERVIETHFHADFLSGHLELAAATGAVISYGEGAEAQFAIEALHDRQRLSLGTVTLEIRATPGHTPESISVVVYESPDAAVPFGVLTGDTLFIGDVGRPDLLASKGVTAEELARRLYHSVREQLMTLPDETGLYPGHGAGSACGKNMSSAPRSTIGEQRLTNYAVRAADEDRFVELVVSGQSAAPPYFPFAASANRSQHELLSEDDDLRPIGLGELDGLLATGAVLLDARPPEVYASGHLRGALNVSLDGRFAEYAGDVVAPDQPIVLVAEDGREHEAKVRLARIGYDRVLGYLPDPEQLLATHPEMAERSTRLPAADLASWRQDEPRLQLIDVRNAGELEGGMIDGARTIPLPELSRSLAGLDPTLPTVVYCAGGLRSTVAASLLRHEGFSKVADVLGGFGAWVSAGLPVSKVELDEGTVAAAP